MNKLLRHRASFMPYKEYGTVHPFVYTLLNSHAIASVKSLLHTQTVYTHFVMIVTDDDANDCGPVAPFKIDMFQGSCFQ